MISDWLREPSPEARCNLSMKKTVYVLLLFVLLISLGVVQIIFIEKFDFILPRLIHLIIFIIELITFLIFIFGIYPERTPLLLPFAVAEIVRVAVLIVLIAYYIILNFQDESLKTLGRSTGHLFFVLVAHIFIVHAVLSTYQYLRRRDGTRLPYSMTSPAAAGHHVIVLRQPIEEEMYGKKPQLQQQQPRPLPVPL